MQPLRELSQSSTTSVSYDPSCCQLLGRYVADHVCEPGRRDYTRPVLHEWVQFSIGIVVILWLPGLVKVLVSHKLNTSQGQAQIPGFCSPQASGHMLLGAVQMLLMLPPTYWIRVWRALRRYCASPMAALRDAAPVEAMQDLKTLHRWSQLQACALLIFLVGYHLYNLVKRVSFLSHQFFHSSYFRNESDFALGAFFGLVVTTLGIPALRLLFARRSRRRRVCNDEYFPLSLSFWIGLGAVLCMYTTAAVLFVTTMHSEPIDPDAAHH